VFRKSYPRKQALAALVQVIIQHLPNTVQPLTGEKRAKKHAIRKKPTNIESSKPINRIDLNDFDD
jgi:hypothetical protein